MLGSLPLNTMLLWFKLKKKKKGYEITPIKSLSQRMKSELWLYRQTHVLTSHNL